ncbi:MAG: hypothetical protein ACREIT_03425 [Tepidisphaeraceae bacterium]
MSQQELLIRVVTVLEGAGIPYMVTGSTASSMQGNPRSTHDIDLVVQITPADIPKVRAAFPPDDYAFDDVAAVEAIRRRDMFQLWHYKSGDKVDFWTLKPEPYDQSCFARRHRETVYGVGIFVSRPEDTILQKLKWSVMCGGSEKQFNDVLGVYEIQYAKLDMAYIERWVDALEVCDLWARVQREAKPL